MSARSARWAGRRRQSIQGESLPLRSRPPNEVDHGAAGLLTPHLIEQFEEDPFITLLPHHVTSAGLVERLQIQPDDLFQVGYGDAKDSTKLQHVPAFDQETGDFVVREMFEQVRMKDDVERARRKRQRPGDVVPQHRRMLRARSTFTHAG